MRKRGPILALLTGFATVSFAHHSTNLGYDVSKVTELDCEFIEFKWMNPHSLMKIKVKNAQGQEEIWTAETHAATVLGRFGWRPTMFKPGDKLTLIGNPPRKPDQHTFHMIKTRTAEGKTYSVNEKISS